MLIILNVVYIMQKMFLQIKKESDSNYKNDNKTTLGCITALSDQHNHRLYMFCRKQNLQRPGRRN